MTIEITRLGDDVAKHASWLIYGESGVGKTWLAKTLPLTSDEKLLYIAVDPGQLTLRDRPDFSKVQAPNGLWSKEFLLELYEYIRDNSNKFEWVFVDGLDDLGEAVLAAEKKRTTNLQKAYGEMADFMKEWVLRMRDINGTNTILVTHIDSDKDSNNQYSFFPSFPGQAFKKRMKDYFDFVGCMRIVEDESGKKRMIQFSREADIRYEVKERGGVVAPLEEPNLASIMSRLQDAGFRVIDKPPQRSRADLKFLQEKLKEKSMKAETVITKFGAHPKTFDDETWESMLQWLETV